MLKILVLLLTINIYAQSGISSTATFGRHSNCSTGRGACSLALSKQETGMYSRKTAANTITLEMSNSILKESDQIKIAGKPFTAANEGNAVFVQEETITIDSTAIENLNLDRKFNKILPGTYAMQITKDKTEIVFVLKNAD